MDASIGFSDRNSLDAMSAPFVFQTAISALALHDKGDILDTALGGFVDIQDFDLPASIVGVAAVHAEELACEKRCFVTAGSCLYRDNSVFLIHTIFGQQGNLYLIE